MGEETVETVNVDVTILGLRGVEQDDPDALFQCVWQAFGHQNQTPTAVQKGGVVEWGSVWQLRDVPARQKEDEKQRQLNLACWCYPQGVLKDKKPKNVGLLGVKLAAFDEHPEQKFDLPARAGVTDGARVRLEIIARPARESTPSVSGSSEEGVEEEAGPSKRRLTVPAAGGKTVLKRDGVGEQWGLHLGEDFILWQVDEGAATRSDPGIRRFVGCGLTHVNGKTIDTRDAIVNALRPALQVELTFAPGDVDAILVSPVQVREWVAEILTVSSHPEQDTLTFPAREGQMGITDGNLRSIPEEGESLEKTLTLFLDDTLLRTTGRQHPRFPQHSVSESLAGAVVQTYVACTGGGQSVARTLRAEVSGRLLDALKLPQQMLRRVMASNSEACSFVLHLAQYHALLKTDADLQRSREARRVHARSCVVYMGEEAWQEWRETGVAQALAFELPLVALRKVPSRDGAVSYAALREMIADDVTHGATPAALVCRLGCEGSAAGDDVEAAVRVCREHRLWLHVEGPAVFLVRGQSAGNDALREAVQSTTASLNVSVAVCEDEVPGLRKLPGFWVFSSGSEAGGRQLPRDTCEDADVESLRSVVVSWLRMRRDGGAYVESQVAARLTEGCRLRAVLKDINQRSGMLGATAVARLHTHAANIWNVRFTIMPADHPLVSSDSADAGESRHPVSVERINTVNRALHRMLKATGGGTTAFDLRDEGGLLRWCFSLATTSVTERELSRLREVVLGAAESMLCVSRAAHTVSRMLEEVPQLNVTRRAPELNPLELCAFRLIPRFYDAQEELAERDLRDIDNINRSLSHHLSTLTCAARFGFYEHDEGVSGVTCSLPSAEDPGEEAVERIAREIAGGVEYILSHDDTVLRIEDEMTQRGIAVAEEQLQQSAARHEEMVHQSYVRAVPLVGEVMNWLLPVPPVNEGLRFDLTTSTLRKEERTTEEAERRE
eukprot:Hpha_TRINITY_DN15121_c1_g3::TRINITY_DN15121_c1_g3_i1::g.126540::m.126540